MTRIRKAYFTLGELAGEWGLPDADLRYVGENGLLKLSVRVIGAFAELGTWEETGDGECMSIPHEHCYHDGLLDLYKRDVFTLFRTGLSSQGISDRAMAMPRCCGTRTSSACDPETSW